MRSTRRTSANTNSAKRFHSRDFLRLLYTVPASLMVVGLLTAKALACPFCTAPSLTLSEQMDQSDAVLEVKFVSSAKGDNSSAGTTTVEVSKIIKAPSGTLKVGSQIELVGYRDAVEGKTYLLTGTQAAAMQWDSPMDVSQAAFDYIVNAPAPGRKYDERLSYFLKFLEHEDDLVAGDAYGEFANAPFEEIAKLSGEFPSEKLRGWIMNKKTSPTRLGLYGLLIGLSGNDKDALVLHSKIMEPTEDFRLGIDGIMSGYLLIAREQGLQEIVREKLKNEDIPFSETYAAMQALRFMWSYAPDRIAADELKRAMRELLNRPDLADMVIADLSRWKDWEVADEVVALYDDEDYAIPSIKRAIVRYLLVCEQSEKLQGDAEPSDHVKLARKTLAEIEETDPKIYRDAKRFFRLR